MSIRWDQRPAASEHAEYFGQYVSKVPDGDILQSLAHQQQAVAKQFQEVPLERHQHRYAQGKWSVKEVFGHMIDTERIFGYRALCFARGEQISLPAFEEDEYVAAANFDEQPMSLLCEQFVDVRRATISLFRSMTPEMLERQGNHSDAKFSFNVRTAAWLAYGHCQHHSGVVRDRYLG